MKRKNKVRFVTKGSTLEGADSTKGITRIRETGDALNVHHDGPVDYEKMWKDLRVDADIFWAHFLPKVQAGLCKGCQEHFTKVFTEANRRAGIGIREGGPAGTVPPEAEQRTIVKRRCKCTAGSQVGKPAQCQTQTDHHSGYCDECRYRCCDLQRHNLDHSKDGTPR